MEREVTPHHVLMLTCAELDAVVAGLAWASQLKRAYIDSALDKACAAAHGQENRQ